MRERRMRRGIECFMPPWYPMGVVSYIPDKWNDGHTITINSINVGGGDSFRKRGGTQGETTP
jgi:hypothetical protein